MRNNTKGIGVGIAVIIVVLVVLFSADRGPWRAIVGRWEGIQGPGVADTIEFFKDGTMSVAQTGTSMGGDYKFIALDRLKTTVGSTTMVFKVSISKNELTLVELNGMIYKYRRIE